jgi:hypothetical protein
MSDPKDDPVLVKYAGVGALAEAREQLDQLDRDALAELDYELIDKMFTTYMITAPEKDRTRKKAIEAVRKAYTPAISTGPISVRKVEMALAEMEKKRQAEEVRTPTLFTMTPEAEAKAKLFKAQEAKIKAEAKARFLARKAKHCNEG